jgi:hypothetical protein
MHNAVVFNKFDSLAKKVIGFEEFRDETTIYQRRLCLRSKVEYYRKNGIPKILHQYLNKEQKEKLEKIAQLKQLQQLQQLERLEQLQQLEQLQRLEQLERLEQLQQLNFYNNSYEKIPILNDSIIYCDIPYKGTGEYDKNKHFDHDIFFDWANEVKHPVYISEYNISDKRFKLVKTIKKRSLMSSKNEMLVKKEKIYINKFGYKKYYE